MSVSFRQVDTADQTARLVERLQRIVASLEWSRAAIPAEVAQEVQAAIARSQQRLDLGVQHAVVALAGGTGSGKSSLFNALVEHDFAVPGVSRPTTSYVSAATWTRDASALLDWLDVAPERRLVMDRDDSPWAGMVVLDLPDHDSVNAANRAVVDRVVPRADLLVWVVDPQKYADHALHSAYLRVASGHGQPSVVVLNHADRLGSDDVVAVVEDLRRLLAEDGLEHVDVLATSTVTGQGITELREHLQAINGQQTVAWRAVRADLVAAGRALEGALARDAQPQMPSVDACVKRVGTVAGVDARADSAALVAMGEARQIRPVGEVPHATVEQVRTEWIDAATAGLPVQWHTVLNSAVTGAESLAHHLNTALALAAWPNPARPARWLPRVVRARRAAGARQRTVDYGRDVVRQVIETHVVEPTRVIHESYRALDELTELD